jgi:hypothetical protein
MNKDNDKETEEELPNNVYPYTLFRVRQFSEEVKRQLPKELWDNPPDADRNEKIKKALNKQRSITEVIKWRQAVDSQKKPKLRLVKDDEDA